MGWDGVAMVNLRGGGEGRIGVCGVDSRPVVGVKFIYFGRETRVESARSETV